MSETPSATRLLQLDHHVVRRVGNLAERCSKRLYANGEVAIEDMEVLSVIIEEFVDRFHHGKEEKAYFPEAKDIDSHAEDVRRLLIEHELGRRIARMFRTQLQRWKQGADAREPVARFLKSYSVFVTDHTGKEDMFFETMEAGNSIPSDLDSKLRAHYELCKNDLGGQARIEELLRLIDYLEGREWMR